MVVSRGKYRGLKLKSLEGINTRPTLAKVKEAIFSMLNNHCYDAQVLDLFAGSGSLGIEALSCEASQVRFNDNSYEAISVIKENLAKLKCENYLITKSTYQEVLKNEPKEEYDLIFLDPPYHLKIINELIEKIIINELLAKNGIIVCECSLDEDIMSEFRDLFKYKEKKYGKTKITMFRREENENSNLPGNF